MSRGFKVRDSRNKDFFIVDNIYLNGYAKKLGVHATSVYLSLCRHADQSQTCFPSQKLISEETGMGERTVRDKIDILVKYNIIKVERERNSNGEWMRNLYTLLDKSEWLDKPEAALAGSDLPEANDDIYQRQPLPINNTNTYNNTNTLSMGKFSKIDSLTEEQFETIATSYQVPLAFVKSKYDDMINWHESTGKRKKNWYATLRNWVKSDAMKIRKGENNGQSKIRVISPDPDWTN